MKRKFDNSPRMITLKYGAICAETGASMPAGDEVLYYPGSKQFYCAESKTAQDYRSQAFADAYGLGDAGW